VGGDFLDYLLLADGCVGLYLRDVSGNGLPAAMFAALAVGTLRGVHKTGMCPSRVLATLNRRLMIRGATRRHAAVQYAVFDPQTREMKIAGRGMPGPFHLSANGDYRALEVQGKLEPGDSVLFFTDGLPDAFDAEDESFGLERLQAVCVAQSERSATDFLGEVFSAVTRFAGERSQHDHMAAAVFQYRDSQE